MPQMSHLTRPVVLRGSILSEVADEDSKDAVFKLLQSDEATTRAQGLTLDWKLDKLEDEFEDKAMDLFSFE